MPRCRAVVFDLDGTLVDAFEAVADALNAARGAFGRPPLPLDEVRRQVGWGLVDLLAKNVGADAVPRARAIFETRYAARHLRLTRPLPGVPEALEDLSRRGAVLGVASNKPPPFTSELLRHLGIAPLFGAIVGPGPGLPPKPEPAMLWTACTQLGVAPAETLYVGDMPLDLESAMRAGMPPLLVATGAFGAEALRGQGGAEVARDLFEVAERVTVVRRKSLDGAAREE